MCYVEILFIINLYYTVQKYFKANIEIRLNHKF